MYSPCQKFRAHRARDRSGIGLVRRHCYERSLTASVLRIRGNFVLASQREKSRCKNSRNWSHSGHVRGGLVAERAVVRSRNRMRSWRPNNLGFLTNWRVIRSLRIKGHNSLGPPSSCGLRSAHAHIFCACAVRRPKLLGGPKASGPPYSKTLGRTYRDRQILNVADRFFWLTTRLSELLNSRGTFHCACLENVSNNFKTISIPRLRDPLYSPEQIILHKKKKKKNWLGPPTFLNWS